MAVEESKTEDKKTEDKKTEDKKTEDKKTEDKKTEDKKNGAQQRSDVTYPYYPFTKCMEIVQAVHRVGGNEAANSEVIKELNVGKNDRLWAYGVPASMYFGLIERIGRGEEGRLRVTELANTIVLPGTPEEARAAKVAAVSRPELYAKLLERFAGAPLPTKDGLRNVLVREFGIVESMAPNAADAFLESVKAAEMIAPGNVLSTAKSSPEQPPPGDSVKPKVPGMQSIQVPENFVPHHFPLRKDLTIIIPLPADLTSRDVGRLSNWLKTLTFDDGEVKT